ncbi:hypothetical protein M422DRAFT_213623, partial [Sphaerobolus stellatus SS14]
MSFNPSSGSDDSQPETDIAALTSTIHIGTIANLARNSYSRIVKETVPCVVNSKYIVGTDHVVWPIYFEDGAQWIIRIPQRDWSPLLEKNLQANIDVMNFIGAHTTIPLPRIYGYSTNVDNPLGRPYVFMQLMSGKLLWERWFDPEWFTERRRKTVFRSLAEYLCQLNRFKLPALGTIQIDPISQMLSVGPILPTPESVDEEHASGTANKGPYFSVTKYFHDELTPKIKNEEDEVLKADLISLRMFIRILVDPALDGPPFVLQRPDLHLQNILVDVEGNITGLIDWDGVCLSSPRQNGYAGYPSWITRDWDPLQYTY